MNKKTINLRGLQAKLSAKELKNVLGGSGDGGSGRWCASFKYSGSGKSECFECISVGMAKSFLDLGGEVCESGESCGACDPCSC